MTDPLSRDDAETLRLTEDATRTRNWKRWGPYLAERQWGTVREDYSPDGTSWDYFPHDHARSRTYRWGEDGLLGITDREGRLCFALALWNESDPILKERLFGLTGPEGNHGEDVKECYFYLDATPTHSYLKALYKYPQRAYPYTWLVEENRRRGKHDAEFELVDTGVFDDGRYFDVTAEYAKASPEDILVRVTIANRGPDAAPLRVLPTLWFRNTWSWGRTGESYWPKPRLARAGEGTIVAEHASLGRYRLEADAFYARHIPGTLGEGEQAVVRQAYASLLWSKKFYHYVVKDWLEGDPAQPPPPASRRGGRNADWRHLYNRDVVSMPEGWEYPWYAAWDLAFHMIPFARVDPHFAKEQLVLFTREWYMHPSGQLPAYEWAFSDVNPPVHAWSAWRVYKMSGPRGGRDRVFLSRIFQELALNFAWWVNRKDTRGNNLFGGGFLGLDNIGVFDRSHPLPGAGALEQADGTAWMGFFCVTLLEMALELAREDPACEDMASKYFEHFIAIVDAMNTFGGTGLWCPEDGFYYDQLQVGGRVIPLRVRSMVGLLPLMACTVLDEAVLERFPAFTKRMRWFLENRPDLARFVTLAEADHGQRLLAIPSRERLQRTLRYMLDENEFLSPHGIRSLSQVHRERPFVLAVEGQEYAVHYTPADSDTTLFGGNSNWRGPVWFPVNYLLVEALERYHHFYGDGLRVECPTGSGQLMNLRQVVEELSRRLAGLFLRDERGRRPAHGDDPRYAEDPHWRELALFYEYFHGDTGRGVGAPHQTGWTALAASLLENVARAELHARGHGAHRAARVRPQAAGVR